MYSVVLMMAMSGGADVPAFGHHRGGDCCGCYGGGCYGGGCYGGGCYGGGGHHRHHRRGGGCCGCYGGGYSGGCWGGATYGGCYGGATYGGGMMPVYESMPSTERRDGSRDSGRERLNQPGDKKSDRKEDRRDDRRDESKDQVSLTAPATLVVSVPAQAKLTIDDYVTRSTSSVRTFTSPALTPGKDFQYTLKAELVRDGKTFTARKTVVVRAGDQVNVVLDPSAERVAQK